MEQSELEKHIEDLKRQIQELKEERDKLRRDLMRFYSIRH